MNFKITRFAPETESDPAEGALRQARRHQAEDQQWLDLLDEAANSVQPWLESFGSVVRGASADQALSKLTQGGGGVPTREPATAALQAGMSGLLAMAAGRERESRIVAGTQRLVDALGEVAALGLPLALAERYWEDLAGKLAPAFGTGPDELGRLGRTGIRHGLLRARLADNPELDLESSELTRDLPETLKNSLRGLQSAARQVAASERKAALLAAVERGDALPPGAETEFDPAVQRDWEHRRVLAEARAGLAGKTLEEQAAWVAESALPAEALTEARRQDAEARRRQGTDYVLQNDAEAREVYRLLGKQPNGMAAQARFLAEEQRRLGLSEAEIKVLPQEAVNAIAEEIAALKEGGQGGGKDDGKRGGRGVLALLRPLYDAVPADLRDALARQLEGLDSAWAGKVQAIYAAFDRGAEVEAARLGGALLTDPSIPRFADGGSIDQLSTERRRGAARESDARGSGEGGFARGAPRNRDGQLDRRTDPDGSFIPAQVVLPQPIPLPLPGVPSSSDGGEALQRAWDYLTEPAPPPFAPSDPPATVEDAPSDGGPSKLYADSDVRAAIDRLTLSGLTAKEAEAVVGEMQKLEEEGVFTGALGSFAENYATLQRIGSNDPTERAAAAEAVAESFREIQSHDGRMTLAELSLIQGSPDYALTAGRGVAWHDEQTVVIGDSVVTADGEELVVETADGLLFAWREGGGPKARYVIEDFVTTDEIASLQSDLQKKKKKQKGTENKSDVPENGGPTEPPPDVAIPTKSDDKDSRKHAVYRAFDLKKQVTVYVGMTNNLIRRTAEWLRERGYHIEPLVEGLTKLQARVLEQRFIEIVGRKNDPINPGTLDNKRNSIYPKSRLYRETLKMGEELLKKIDSPDKK